MSENPHRKPFDAVLLVSFGGPGGRHEIRPFLANVLRGRRVAPERVEEVAHHYELFDGVSPITALTRAQASVLEVRLRERGLALPVYVGMRNWHPYLADTLAEMSAAGVRRAIGFITSAHHSYSGCGQYRENVRDARKELMARGLPDVELTYVPSWYEHPAFIATWARHIREALERLDPGLRDAARIVFTAHSIPMSMARVSRYSDQLVATAQMIADELNRDDWALVYQSRSGRPEDPWFEPDVCDYLRAEARRVRAVVLAPIGFVCDHIEVLYDLDHEAGGVCRELGIPMARAATTNDDPQFIDMMADVVGGTFERFRRFPCLPVVARKGSEELSPAPGGRPQ